MNKNETLAVIALAGVAVQTTRKLIQKTRSNKLAILTADHKVDKIAWLAAQEIAVMKLVNGMYDDAPAETLDRMTNDIQFYHTSFTAL